MEVVNDIWLQEDSVCHSSEPGVKQPVVVSIQSFNLTKYLIMEKPFNLRDPSFPIKKSSDEIEDLGYSMTIYNQDKLKAGLLGQTLSTDPTTISFLSSLLAEIRSHWKAWWGF